MKLSGDIRRQEATFARMPCCHDEGMPQFFDRLSYFV